MTTIALYNQATRGLVNNEYDLADLGLMLLNATAFDAAHVNVTSVNAGEVSGNGWPVGGPTLANVAVTTVTTNDAKLDADDVSVTATGGDIGPATAAVIYEKTGGELLAYIDFEGSQTAGDGTPFNINWHADGIVTFTYT